MYNRTLLPERLLTNITILVPNGTTQHGNERLLCLPITSGYWPSISSVIIFFAANYLAHAATVKSSPGDATLVQACNAFLALMFPMSGLLRALNSIFRYSRSAKTALEKACNAGALCMVVRDRHWQPERPSDVRVRVVHRFEEVHDEPHIYADWTTYLPSYAREKPSSRVHFDSVWAQSYVNPRLKRIHGTFALPEGYTFAIVPRDTFLLAKGAPNRRGDNCSVSDISASTSSLKAVASMVQIIAAFTTLLSHRSDLTGRWGYASYHLTVIPYLFMTLVNLVSNLIIADYPCLYMVRTDTMAEAERAGGIFEAEVAQTVTLTDEDVDLNEDAPYGGITIEKIVSFVTTFTHDWMIFWPLSVWEYISKISLRGRLNAKAHRSPRYTSTTVDLQICEDTRVHHVQQLSTVPSSSPTIFDDPIDLNSSESDGHERAGPNDLEDGLGIAMRSAGESYPNDQPKSRYVDAFSSSQRYRIHFHDSPQGLAVGGFDSMLRSAIKDKVKRKLFGKIAPQQNTTLPQQAQRRSTTLVVQDFYVLVAGTTIPGSLLEEQRRTSIRLHFPLNPTSGLRQSNTVLTLDRGSFWRFP
ncbi:hypothetical protein D6C92_04545 [Aureobasidium pullulans]|nr:hypothetical protein D6C92_04545 [Aureobasidium pullulans]